MIFNTCYTALLVTGLALFPTSLRADEVRHGSGIICDTVEQIDEFIKADDEGKDPMPVVNAKTPVCGRGQVAYVKGQKLKEVLSKRGVFEVVEIIVVGVVFNGRLDPVVPFKQITVFLAPGTPT
jgi:hypothetical protein